MRRLILHINPTHVAIVGSAPFLIAGLALLAGVPLPALAPVFAAAAFLGVAFVLIWCWVVGSALNESIPAPQRPSNAPFRGAIAYSAAYAVAGFTRFVPPFGNPALVIGLHLMAWAAMAQVLHFVAKNLSLAEGHVSGRSAPVWRTTVALFSIAGIPAIQCRVNRIFDRT